MKVEKPDWMIHYVAPTVDRSKSPAYYYEPYFSNIHTSSSPEEAPFTHISFYRIE